MRNHRFVESVNVLRQVGDAVSGYGDVSQRVVEICACIPEEESVDSFLIMRTQLSALRMIKVRIWLFPEYIPLIEKTT